MLLSIISKMLLINKQQQHLGVIESNIRWKLNQILMGLLSLGIPRPSSLARTAVLSCLTPFIGGFKDENTTNNNNKDPAHFKKDPPSIRSHTDALIEFQGNLFEKIVPHYH